MRLNWDRLLNSIRRKDLSKNETSSTNAAGDRTEIERDFDRILFSTPVRRLADKTQVFPLEVNDSVRTRLTHSHEVSNIARSIGVALVHREKSPLNEAKYVRDVPAMLAAVGLAHDIGNPPFGHQGEAAIGSWFEKNETNIFGCDDFNSLDSVLQERMKNDYLRFEGNAQAMRILMKLQIINDNFGLNLTCGSLAALMKYPTTSEKANGSNVSTKKFGSFHSEIEACKQVWSQVGLEEGTRHPLAYIMEASDDIAYSVLDAEDAVKKGLVSYQDLIGHLQASNSGLGDSCMITNVVDDTKKLHHRYKTLDLSPKELSDISMQMFRVKAIGAMVGAVTDSFLNNYNLIMDGAFEQDLIQASEAAKLCESLKQFSFKNAYIHQTVLELELQGHKVIHSIMDLLWPAIVSRGDPIKVKKHHGSPFEKYAYGRISENYRRIFEDEDNKLPLVYKQSQLLADMISGMTDSYAVSFESELQNHKC